MLVDKKDRDIFAVVSETIEGLFDGWVVGFGIHDQEVLLCVRRLCDMLQAMIQHIAHLSGSMGSPTPTPASSKPVTESYISRQSLLPTK